VQDDKPSTETTKCSYFRPVKQPWKEGGWFRYVRCRRLATRAGYCWQHWRFSPDGQVARCTIGSCQRHQRCMYTPCRAGDDMNPTNRLAQTAETRSD
jgi:hypothetical protein